MTSHQAPLPYIVLTPTEDLVIRELSQCSNGLSISALSRTIGLARTSIYSAIRALLKKRLISRDGFRYSLQKPLLAKRLPTAQDQIHALMEEILTLTRGEIIRSIESDDEIRELFRDPREFSRWQKTAAEHGIVFKGIGTKSAVRLLQTMSPAEALHHISKRSGSARVTNEEIPAACVVVSFRDSTIFFSRKRLFFYRIDNPDVARFSQGIIDMLYNYLEYQRIA